ncbi:MAG: exodeoxyribonuclease VII small subunit [Ferrovum sp. 37-45-19]|jgi:exodeoxyribonuclease VII small subunit|uniref:exodeoxyribonuclease VII small subunit n=1 Tax=Ferrovum sp. JA12 TaxID=1356299 RepID=UPI000702DAFC|nr:exodeoxyribonuclease VII small subunit [Ferrovum sp. JA12]OYV80574.1 MAG: exodeoxyribonuclease VII small subunit [Ferrovum sp. 21-44-67]OYV94890.1 MAG: exodeoxyribonuclease VII small subunit [Ferrovum sp. 37-45-19]HQT80975.1 exodeoxyribonuclease VII small subunit [Ferrovaceae bacterium]KRH79300.1 exodeoxyribonuclease 7 small subunit [Ferrovum sp. JA12]HQU06208.1 exodeoxyribonuclease VII small subunit [Ferrovaceae bacterium]
MTSQTKSTLTYEDAIKELESLLSQLEGGQLPLEQAIETYRRGAELIRFCQEQLKEAEQKVLILTHGELNEFENGSSSS